MIFLLFLVVQGAVASLGPTTEAPFQCPYGFTLLYTGNCVKLFDTPLLYQDASNACAKYTNGSLVSIGDSVANIYLVDYAKSLNVVRPVWIGMTCTESSPDSCEWVDGTPRTPKIYRFDNFAYGNPSISAGSNVYMLTSGSSTGKWVSANGTFVSLSYFCKFPVEAVPGYCQNEMNGYCYTMNTNSLNEADARSSCQEDCGDLVSIHSRQENDHVYSLIPLFSHLPEVRIGGRTDGIGKYWLDGTPFDFSNFGLFDANIGNCFSMSSIIDVVMSDQWMSNVCDEKIPFICKRPKNATTCAATTPTTLNPNYNQCFTARYYTGNGTIYSPNYPYSCAFYGPCTYVITAPKGSSALVQFHLYSDIITSNVVFYSQLEYGAPFANLTGVLPLNVFRSPTNVLKMVFTGIPKRPDAGQFFVLSYGNDFVPS